MLVAGCVELLREHKKVAIAGGHEHLAARLFHVSYLKLHGRYHSKQSSPIVNF